MYLSKAEYVSQSKFACCIQKLCPIVGELASSPMEGRKKAGSPKKFAKWHSTLNYWRSKSDRKRILETEYQYFNISQDHVKLGISNFLKSRMHFSSSSKRKSWIHLITAPFVQILKQIFNSKNIRPLILQILSLQSTIETWPVNGTTTIYIIYQQR